jgi:hypothetical protein
VEVRGGVLGVGSSPCSFKCVCVCAFVCGRGVQGGGVCVERGAVHAMMGACMQVGVHVDMLRASAVHAVQLELDTLSKSAASLKG